MFWMWFGFVTFVVVMLVLDLGILNRDAHAIPLRESLVTTGAWISLALLFSVFVYCGYANRWFGLGTNLDHTDGSFNGGRSAAIKYLTGYTIELSLSMDNVFVIVLLIAFFGVRQFTSTACCFGESLEPWRFEARWSPRASGWSQGFAGSCRRLGPSLLSQRARCSWSKPRRSTRPTIASSGSPNVFFP
jgi:hypothetical protein